LDPAKIPALRNVRQNLILFVMSDLIKNSATICNSATFIFKQRKTPTDQTVGVMLGLGRIA